MSWPYYHKRKEAAMHAAQELGFADDWEVRAELEPYNGWVIVLNPKDPAQLQACNLDYILGLAEIEAGRLRRRPEGHKQPPPPAKAASGAHRRPKAPPKPPPPPPAPSAAVAPPPPKAPPPPPPKV